MKPDISKFSWAELFSNETGKTSASGFTGVVICLVGTLCFFLGCIDKMFISKEIDIITQSIVFVGIGVALLGVRKVAKSGNHKEKSSVEKVVQTQPEQIQPQPEQPVQQINS
jgi:hypothetical protein